MFCRPSLSPHPVCLMCHWPINLRPVVLLLLLLLLLLSSSSSLFFVVLKIIITKCGLFSLSFLFRHLLPQVLKVLFISWPYALLPHVKSCTVGYCFRFWSVFRWHFNWKKHIHWFWRKFQNTIDKEMLPELFAWNPFRMLLHEDIFRIHFTPLTFFSRSLNQACKYCAVSKCARNSEMGCAL